MDKLVCTVKRSKWVRGGRFGRSLLLNEDGNMCCLGFLGEACGVPTDQLGGVGMPQSVIDYNKYPTGDEPDGINWDKFANVNDALDVTDSVREQTLMQLAEDNGFTFVFVD